MKDGLPYAILGSPGGDDQVMRTMQTLINLIDFHMNIQQAIEAPRWSSRSFPASPFPHTMVPGDMSVEARIPEATRQALIARGHKLRISPSWSLGSTAGIVIDSSSGVLSSGADPRVEAYAWSWRFHSMHHGTNSDHRLSSVILEFLSDSSATLTLGIFRFARHSGRIAAASEVLRNGCRRHFRILFLQHASGGQRGYRASEPATSSR